MSIQFGFLTSSLTTIKQQEFRPATKQFLDRRGVPLVSQSPYSVDLNLLDRFLFWHIKMDLRGEDFSGPEDLSKAIQRSIRHISEITLVEELKKLKSHLDDVIASAGDYISQIH